MNKKSMDSLNKNRRDFIKSGLFGLVASSLAIFCCNKTEYISILNKV